MPPIRAVDLSEGIRIIGTGVKSTFIRIADFPLGSPDKVAQALTRMLQAEYEVWTPLTDIEPDDPIRQNPSILAPCERIGKRQGKNYLVNTLMWVEVRVCPKSALGYTICCADNDSGYRLCPICGNKAAQQGADNCCVCGADITTLPIVGGINDGLW